MRWYANEYNNLKGLIKMIGCFIGGVFVGGFVGVMIMCVLSVAGQTDRDYDSMPSDRKPPENHKE